MSEEKPPDTPHDEPHAPPAGDASSAAAENAEQTALPLDAIGAREIVIWILGVLGAKAWQGMGLVPNSATGKIEKNIPEARLAIDAFAGLLDGVRSHLEEPVRRESEALLTTLRLNFVEKSSGS